MNSQQRYVLIVGLGLIIATALFPPWNVPVRGPVRMDSSGTVISFAFVFAEPGELAIGTLFLEWVVILALTGIVMLLLSEPKSSSLPASHQPPSAHASEPASRTHPE